MDLRELTENFTLNDDTIVRPRSHRGVELQMDSLLHSSFTFTNTQWRLVCEAFTNIEEMLEQDCTLRRVNLKHCSTFCDNILEQEIFRKGNLSCKVEVDNLNSEELFFAIIIYGQSQFNSQIFCLFEVIRKTCFE